MIDGGGITAESGGGVGSITYDAASRSYVVQDIDGAIRLSSDEKISDDGTFSKYRDSATGAVFRQLNKGNPLIALSYVSYGAWSGRGATIDGSAQGDKLIYVTYGSPTSAAAMPRVGSATYNGILDGAYNTAAGVYALSGGAKFVTNFGASTISYTLTPLGTLNNSVIDFGPISGSGSISGATFQASAGYNGPYLSRVAGSFYGPAAEEIGGSFTLVGLGGRAPVTGSGGGVFVGKGP